MRLWHQEIIPYLPQQHLYGQHRECVALRGGGWGKKHSVVDYVFLHSPRRLYDYHMLIIEECERRGGNLAQAWKSPEFRGWIKNKAYCFDTSDYIIKEIPRDPWEGKDTQPILYEGNIYPEHNEDYLQECLQNLKSKGFGLKAGNPFNFS